MPMQPAASTGPCGACAKYESTSTIESASANSIASILPQRASRLSIIASQCTFLPTSKKYLSETMRRNAPPKAPMSGVASARSRPYSSGFSSARIAAVMGETRAAMLTIIAGRISRVPKTANSIPQVKKRRCHFSLICASTFALTTALSKESVTSSTESRHASRNAAHPPHMKMAASAIAEITTGAIKSFMGLGYYKTLWSQVEFSRQKIRSRPRLAVLQMQNIAAPGTKAENLPQGRLFCLLCPGEDSNLQALRHYHLKVASLPISPPGHAFILLHLYQLQEWGPQLPLSPLPQPEPQPATAGAWRA